MSGFWSEALLSVQAKLDAKTESAKERLSSLKETVAATVESAQERIAADIESLKEEHARFIAEQDGDGGSGDEASGGLRAPSESSATDSAVLINASEAASEFVLVHVEDDDPASPGAPDDAGSSGGRRRRRRPDAAVLAEIENVEVGDDDDDDLERQIAAELDGVERGSAP
ncbi:hypothetical protein JL721_9350 [Aureococcus anophagefferens]|nr:hypothetical protein JL721_9350 [Aureococcus anophagefferens]